MHLYYMLVAGEVVPTNNIYEWGQWFENFENRRLATTMFEGGMVMVSTVFLGIDHGFGGGMPVLFETMVFGGEFDQYQKRYRTLDEARVGHRDTVRMVKGEDIDAPDESFGLSTFLND